MHDSPILPKVGFLSLKKTLVINFHRICAIMKIFIICSVPEQILWEKFCSWDIGQNALSLSDCMMLNQLLSRSNSLILIMLIQIHKINKFKYFCWTSSNIGRANLVHYANQEWNNWINWFLHAGTNSCKVDWKLKKMAWSKMRVTSYVMGL